MNTSQDPDDGKQSEWIERFNIEVFTLSFHEKEENSLRIVISKASQVCQTRNKNKFTKFVVLKNKKGQ